MSLVDPEMAIQKKRAIAYLEANFENLTYIQRSLRLLFLTTRIVESPFTVAATTIRAWPHKKPENIYPRIMADKEYKINEIFISREFQIIIIDDLVNYSADQLADSLISGGFHGTIASVRPGPKPEWAKYHFPDLESVVEYDSRTDPFVNFMNDILKDFA